MITINKRSSLLALILTVTLAPQGNTLFSMHHGKDPAAEQAEKPQFQIQLYKQNPFESPVLEEVLPSPSRTARSINISYFNIPIRDQADSFSCGYHATFIVSIFIRIIQQRQDERLTLPTHLFDPELFTHEFNHFFVKAQAFLRHQDPEFFAPSREHQVHTVTHHGIPTPLICEKSLTTQNVLQLAALLLTHSFAPPERFKELILQSQSTKILVIDPQWFFPERARTSCRYIRPDLTIPSEHIRHHYFSFEILKNFQEADAGQLVILFISWPHWTTCLLNKENQETISIYVADSFYHDLETSKMLASIKAIIAYIIQHRVSSEEIDQAIIRLPN